MPQGYLHNEMDVKILVLFILSRIETPLSLDDLYKIGCEDESLNYFMLSECLKALLESGHITADEKNRYSITERGRKQGALVEDSLAVPVRDKASAAITDKIDELRRDSYIKTGVTRDADGNWLAKVSYHVDHRPTMDLSLMAPNEALGLEMAENLRKELARIYKFCFDSAIGDAQQD